MIEEFVTKSGVTLRLARVKPLKIQKLTGVYRNKFLKNDEPIDPPFYYVQLAGGGRQRHYYDEESIQGAEVPQKDKDAWEAHQDALERMAGELEERALEILFLDGVDFDMPTDDSWIEIQEYEGFEIPENPRIRKVHYLLTEVLETDEAVKLATLIMNQSQSQVNLILEDATQVAESFRDSVENKEGNQVK